jgi:hypothetical protein
VCQPPYGRRLAKVICASYVVLVAVSSSPASAKVRVSGLSDVTFGSVSNLEADAVQSQSVCLFAHSNRYSIRADGSGSNGAFVLSSGAANLAYEVRWNSQAGQANGTALSPGAVLGGLTTSAQNQNCASGPPTTASLILILPATALSTATEGAYSGTLTLIVAEE